MIKIIHSSILCKWANFKKSARDQIIGLSDHNLTLIVRKLTKSRFHLKPNIKSHQLRIPKSDIDVFDMEIKNINWSQIVCGSDVDTNTHALMSTIQNISKRFLRKSKSKAKTNHTLPWINSGIRKLMKERDNALRHSLISKLVTDRHIFVSLRNRVTKEIRAAKSNFFVNIIHESKGTQNKSGTVCRT